MTRLLPSSSKHRRPNRRPAMIDSAGKPGIPTMGGIMKLLEVKDETTDDVVVAL